MPDDPDFHDRLIAARTLAWSADRADAVCSLMAEAIRWRGCRTVSALWGLGFSVAEIDRWASLAFSRAERLPENPPRSPRTADMAAVVEAIRSADPIAGVTAGVLMLCIAMPLAALIIFP